MSWTLFEDYLTSHPDEAVALLEQLPPDEVGEALESCPVEAARAALRRMDAVSAAAAARRCSAERTAALLAGLAPEPALRLLRRLAPELRERILAALPEARAEGLRRGLAWPAESAGALMNPEVLALPEGLTVREARRHVRRHAALAADDVWVTTRNGVLVGAVRLRELMLGDGREPLARLVDERVGRVAASASRAALAAHPQWSHRSALPVVDEGGRLLGAVPHEAVRGMRAATQVAAGAGPLAAGLALGELYWVAATGLFGAMLGGEPGEEEGR